MTTPSAHRIEVKTVSKRFIIGGAAPTFDLRERFSLGRRKEARRERAEAAEFWALKNIGFTVEAGKTLGIVGHNGSGKSTMLKLLTGIMQPTSGSVQVKGRVGALIEVGAGFHPDLTGRENVFLNGSILGLSRREIGAKFDEIVSFAGLEKFIDTPVKRYSSGMYMRLGFAIASHVNPDVLLIDEVLAVGDAQFQRKCLRRLKEFVSQGGTAVFVSHAAGQVAEFCDRCLWLDHGQLMYDGPTAEALRRYQEHQEHQERQEPSEQAEPTESVDAAAALQAEVPDPAPVLNEADAGASEAEAGRIAAERERRNDLARPYLFGAQFVDDNDNARTAFRAGESLRLRVDYRMGADTQAFDPVFALQIHRDDGLYMVGVSNHDQDIALDRLPQTGSLTLHIPFLALNEGRYFARLFLSPNPEAGDFHLFPPYGADGDLMFTVSAGRRAHGVSFMDVRWEPVATRNGLPLPRPVSSAVSPAAPVTTVTTLQRT